jgi:septum formation protein
LKVKELSLYLASASPRRLELLSGLGLEPQILRHSVDETPHPAESPEDHARRLAEAKGRDAATTLDAGEAGVVLAADTVVTIDGSILGKPVDQADAASMLRRLRGRSHQVLTALFLRRVEDGRESSIVESTGVQFREYDDSTLEAYVGTGEPLDKAGAYGIQGLGAFLSRRIDGSWSNVVGLPLERLPACLGRVGIDPLSLFRGRLSSR